MGLVRRLTDAIAERRGDTTEATEPGDDEMVNVNKRAAIVAYYYDVSPRQARHIAAVLRDRMDRANDATVEEIAAGIREETGLSPEVADRIAHNERASIVNTSIVAAYEERPGVEGKLFHLPGDVDEDSHPVRVDVDERIRDHGGAVSLSELRDLFREAAEKYEDEGGTPERVDHWLAHERPTYTITRYR
jgi:hypothetical protein